MPDNPVSCRLTPAALRARREGLLARLFGRCLDRRPLPEGFAFTFAPGEGLLAGLAEMIELERECCPFLTFRLEVAPEGGPVTLEMTGPAGTTQFLETELRL